MPRSDITGFLLAGGRGTRMGTDKALIPWGSGTLLSHAVGVLHEVVAEAFVVGREGDDSDRDFFLLDKVPGRGPLCGIQTALSRTATEWNLVLAVDLPLMDRRWFAFLCDACDRTAAQAVVPRVDGRLQPLCAAYRRSLLPEFARAVHAGELSIHRLLESLAGSKMEAQYQIEIIEQPQLIAHGFQPEMFTNVNTPEDLERVKAMAQVLHGHDH